MQWNQLGSEWSKVQAQFRTRWAKLTDDDLKAIAGKKDELIARIQKTYGIEKSKAEKEAEDFVKKLH
jgi:uncharacterized protein YjbJ (UPF0337 family)